MHWASGLNLLYAAIAMWNTAYFERAESGPPDPAQEVRYT